MVGGDPRVNVVMDPALYARFEEALNALKRTKKGERSKVACEAIDAWLKQQGY